jgi:hypothetical protein
MSAVGPVGGWAELVAGKLEVEAAGQSVVEEAVASEVPQ